MFGTRWRLFRLFGIPINIDASWLIVLALITWTLARYYREEVPDLAPSQDWVMGLATAVAFFVCIVLHEMGHALAARAQGMRIRGITLFLFGGIAELETEPPSAWDEFVVAIAGPIVSAALGGLFWALAIAGEPTWPRAADVFLAYLARINIMVLLFNLIPAFPLDGGRVLRSVLWGISSNLRKATYWSSLLGQGFAWVLILVGVLSFFAAGGFIQGLWMLLIGIFLRDAARGSYQQVVIRQLLEGVPVRRLMNREPVVVPPGLSLQSWVEDYVYRYHRKTFPVAEDGRLLGCMSTRSLARFPRGEWDRHTVGEAMRRDVAAVSVSADDDALEALRRMQRAGSSRLLVTEGGRLAGILSNKDLMHYLQLQMELEDNDRDDGSTTDEAMHEETAVRQ